MDRALSDKGSENTKHKSFKPAHRSHQIYTEIAQHVYMRPGRKIVQTGLTSSSSLDRTDYLQTRMNSERHKCKHKYISDWYVSAVLFRTMHAHKSTVKKENGGQGELKDIFCVCWCYVRCFITNILAGR